MILQLATYFIIQVYSSKLILSNEIYELSLYQIQNEDKIFSIWIRFQTQFINQESQSKQIPFAQILTFASQKSIILSYQYYQQLQFFIHIPKLEYKEKLAQIIIPDKQSWFLINLLKEQEFYQVQINNITLELPELQQKLNPWFGSLVTWQNITFSLRGYLENQYIFNQDSFYLLAQNFIRLSKLVIMNYKYQIAIEMFIKICNSNFGVILQITDKEYNYQLIYGFQNVLIEIQSEQDYKSKQFNNINPDEWFRYHLYFEINKTITQIYTSKKNYQWIYENKFQQFIQGQQPMYYGMIVYFHSQLAKIDNIIISDILNSQQSFDNCFPGCKTCLDIQCLECDANLNLSNGCSCDQNQFYNKQLKTCQDFTIQSGIQQNLQQVIVCQMYEYFNIQQQKCLKCPKIQEHYCTDCVFNTKLWKLNQTCTFQEINSEIMLNLFSLNFDMIENFIIRFDESNTLVKDNRCEFFQENGQIICHHYDWDEIQKQMCDPGQYSQLLRRCKIEKRYFSKLYKLIMCMKGYTQINLKCSKCPLNCVICEFKANQIQCLITNEGYYIERRNNLIKGCTDDNQICQYTNFQEEIQKDNCLIQFQQLCLFCAEHYLLDQNLDCVLGSKLSFQYNFEFFSDKFNRLSYKQLIQLAQNQDEIIQQLAFKQIIFYGKQYEYIKINQGRMALFDDSSCNQFIAFNNSYRCVSFKENFIQLYNDENINYCPNDNCTYNLTLNITIYISNIQIVLYGNQSYRGIQELLDNLLLKLYLTEIHFIAKVYVFDSFDQNCFDRQILQLDKKYLEQHFSGTIIKLTLIFQAISQFPECSNQIFYSNIDYIEVRNLETSNQLLIEFQSVEVQFFDCKFFQNLQLIIKASKIIFQNVSFLDLFQTQTLILLYQNEQIQEIFFLSCNFFHIDIQAQNIFIDIQSYAQKIVMENITFFEVYISNSLFFKFHSFQLMQINQMDFVETNCHKSTIFYQQQFLKNGRIYMDNINIMNTELQQSIFYQSDQQTQILNMQIIKCTFWESQLLQLRNKVVLNNLLLKEIYIESLSYFIYFQNYKKNMIMKDVKIIDSLFYQTVASIYVEAYDLQVEQLYVQNCEYYPPFNILDIKAYHGAIQKISINNLKMQKQDKQLVVVLPDFVFEFKIENLIIVNTKFHNITFNQIQLIHILFRLTEILDFYISNCTLIGGSLNEIIRLSQQDQSSLIRMENVQVKHLKIEWQLQSQLIYMQGENGICHISNMLIQNIVSLSEYQILYCQKVNIYLINIRANFRQFIGFIKQQQAKVKIQNYYQLEEPSNQKSWNTSIFSNIKFQSSYELFIIENSAFTNIRQPILKFDHNKFVELHIRDIKIIKYQGLMDIFQLSNGNMISTNNYSQIIFHQYLQKIIIYDTFQNQNYLTYCQNSKTYMSQIYLLNSSLVIFYGFLVDSLKASYIYINNSNVQNKSVFFINNIGDKLIIQNMYFKNLTGQAKIFEIQLTKTPQSLQIINIQNIYMHQCNNLQNFIKIDQSLEKLVIYRLDSIYIKGSSFQSDLFDFNLFSTQAISIKKLIILDTILTYLSQNTQPGMKFNELNLINVIFLNYIISSKVQLTNSYIHNCTQNGQQLIIKNDTLFLNQNQKIFWQPLALSFNLKNYFDSKQIQQNIYEVSFNNMSKFVYVPTGIQFSQFIYIDPITKEYESPYQNFIIILNQLSHEHIACNLNQSIDNQLGQYSNINQFELKNGINIIEDFIFIMNPYLNYTYIQNDITCNNQTLRFNVRILPCQLGEYLYQNQCLTCDISKNYYSVVRRALKCEIIDILKIQKLQIGKIMLRSGFWRANHDSNKIEECNNELCLGGWTPGDSSCTTGYVGALCKECDIYNLRGQGKYAQQSDGCALCDFSYKIIVKGVFISFWLMFLGYMSYSTNKQITQQYLVYKITKRNLADILMRQSINQISIIIKISTNYIFFLYLLKDELDFINYQVHISLDFISNPNMLVKPQLDCEFVDINKLEILYIQFLYTVISPFYTLSLFYLIYLLLLKFKLIQFQFNLIQLTIYSVYLFNQQLIFQNQIQLLSYNTVSNIKWIHQNQQFQYSTPQHYHMMYFYIIPSTILLLLVPLILLMILKNKDKKSVRTLKYYGLLFRDYKLGSYYWEIIRIYQKYVIIILFYSFDNKYILFSLSMFFVLLVFNRPYALKNLNYLESKSCYILTLIMNISLMSDNSNDFRGMMFLILNTVLFQHILMSLIQKSNLQYKNQIIEMKIKLIQRLPFAAKFINITKYVKLKNNLTKLRLFYDKQKTKSLLKCQELKEPTVGTYFETLQTENLQTEIEMATIQKEVK